MNSWRVILQLESAASATIGTCNRYDIEGVTVPARIAIVACDPIGEPYADQCHAHVERQLGAGGSKFHCGSPKDMSCMAWREPSCRHVLVLVIGDKSLSSSYEQRADAWLQQSGNDARIVVALVPPLAHSAVFQPGAFPTLEQAAAAVWNGVSSELANIVMTEALLDERRGVFVSYLRSEASDGADQIHDALTHDGYRVFVDRFSGTPGRLFPSELAEAMSSMGLVLLLETSGLAGSQWTMWEAGFARRYRLGPIAVNFDKAPKYPGASDRIRVSEDPSSSLTSSAVSRIVDFVNGSFLKTAIARQAYFEALIRKAARSKGGDVHAQRGLLSIVKGKTIRATASPVGVPGQLRHVARLARSGLPTPHILAGEHQHLPPRAHADLRWLAQQAGVRLAGSGSIYRAVRRLV